MIQVKKFTFNPVSVNSYIIWDETSEAVLIDPSCYTGNEKEQLHHFIEKNHLKPVRLINTHGHFDHLMGNEYAGKQWDLISEIHAGDLVLAEQAHIQSSLFGIDMSVIPRFGKTLKEGEEITFGNSSLRVIFVPGHSEGGIALYAEKDYLLFTGDILFFGSVGRTDLPGGNYRLLIDGIHKKLMVLNDEVIVYAGHGQETTIGRERRENPFLIG